MMDDGRTRHDGLHRVKKVECPSTYDIRDGRTGLKVTSSRWDDGTCHVWMEVPNILTTMYSSRNRIPYMMCAVIDEYMHWLGTLADVSCTVDRYIVRDVYKGHGYVIREAAPGCLFVWASFRPHEGMEYDEELDIAEAMFEVRAWQERNFCDAVPAEQPVLEGMEDLRLDAAERALFNMALRTIEEAKLIAVKLSDSMNRVVMSRRPIPETAGDVFTELKGCTDELDRTLSAMYRRIDDSRRTRIERQEE